ncbi:MAG: HAMP domain-containing histidine kinase [Actinomycetota bacterium]|nr:HAMP domain-containing histidine kinase [Actinomycetota bacterium]
MTVRLRLTLLLGALVTLVGAAILALNFFLVSVTLQPSVERRAGTIVERSGQYVTEAPSPTHVEEFQDSLVQATLRELTLQSAVALAAMSAVSLGISWLVAGRMLRPVHRITETARRLSERDLSQRIPISGPRDELNELARTFNEMLDRLDQAFTGQRRFVANASHQLRTPLAITRSAVDVIDAKPKLEEHQVKSMIAEVRQATIRSEELISALLALARADQIDCDREAVDLAELARMESAAVTPQHPTIHFHSDLEPAVVHGDLVLLQELVRNLIENAALHNQTDGRVWMITRTSGGIASLTVENTGPVIAPQSIDRLFEPFQRGTKDRVATPKGSGLGLSIVRAVARRHHADIHATARLEGGLRVTVSIARAQADA